MDYYGTNDFRNYLSHHGVLGMKWGIRRFQPYGQGGYERKDGKTGKTVGKVKSSTKAKLSSDQLKTVNIFRKQARDAKKEADGILKNGIDNNATFNKYARTRYYQYMREAQIEQATKHGVMSFDGKPLDNIGRRTYQDVSSTDFFKNTQRRNAPLSELKKRDLSDIQNEIEARSGEWYESRAYSPRYMEVMNGPIRNRERQARADYYKAVGTKESGKAFAKVRDTNKAYIDALAGAALKDMGYKDTQEARDYLRESRVINWD